MQITQKLSVALLFSALSGCTSYYPNSPSGLHNRSVGKYDLGNLPQEERFRRYNRDKARLPIYLYDPYAPKSAIGMRTVPTTHRELRQMEAIRPSQDSRIVELNNWPSEEEKKACMRTISYPITQKPGSYSGEASTVVMYDINEYGFPANLRIMDDKANGLLKNNSLHDVANSRFEPPILDGQRLYCRHVRENFSWSQPWFLRGITTRTGPVGSVWIKSP